MNSPHSTLLPIQDAYAFALEGKHPSFTTWRYRPTGEEKYTNDSIFYNDVGLRCENFSSYSFLNLLFDRFIVYLLEHEIKENNVKNLDLSLN